MNERIWELAEQAITDDLPTPIAIPTEFVVRLAELLVQECASFMNEYATNGDVRTGNDLLKHFGVEE